MKRNQSGQTTGVQLTSLDGGDVTTGTTTVYITGDDGTQAIGTVGSGVCTHKGHGYWTYKPSQAESDFEHIAFTYVNSLAMTATVQVYTAYPQTGDAYGLIGANGSGLTSLAAQSTADAIKAKTDNLPADPASNTQVNTRMATFSYTAPDNTSITAIKAKTDQLTFTTANVVDCNAPSASTVASSVRTNLTTELGRIDVAISTRSTYSGGAVASVTDPVTVGTNNDKTGYSLSVTPPTVSQILTTQITESYRANGAAPTLAQALCELISFDGEKSVSGTTVTTKKFDHATAAMSYTLDSSTTPTTITRAT